MIVSMLLALADVEHEAIAACYESGFRGAASHRGHGLGYDPVTEQCVATDGRDWHPEELDETIADRKSVLLEWLQATEVPGYLRDAGIDAERQRILRSLLTGWIPRPTSAQAAMSAAG
jgi:protein-tyrosine phosphatase